MVCINMPVLSLEIEPLSNTSNPKRSGTRIRFNLLKEGLPLSSLITSVIKSLAALLPISIAANLKVGGSLFVARCSDKDN